MIEERIATQYVPLWIGGSIRGRVRRDLLTVLQRQRELEPGPIGLQLREGSGARAQRSRTLQSLARALHSSGLIADWRDEKSAVLDETGTEIARCERGAFRTLGIQNRAVHVNGYLADGRVWVARRSARKRSDPGMLDNLAAGGVAAGESLRRCAIRELWEEAGIRGALARSVDLQDTTIRSLREVLYGLHDEQIIVADLLLPDEFRPHNNDGEVQEFLCLGPERVQAALARGEFTIEAALTLREFLARQR